jgi:hypothetical protein
LKRFRAFPSSPDASLTSYCINQTDSLQEAGIKNAKPLILLVFLKTTFRDRLWLAFLETLQSHTATE